MAGRGEGEEGTGQFSFDAVIFSKSKRGSVLTDSSLSLSLQLVKNPSVLEGSLSELGGLLLELIGEERWEGREDRRSQLGRFLLDELRVKERITNLLDGSLVDSSTL